MKSIIVMLIGVVALAQAHIDMNVIGAHYEQISQKAYNYLYLYGVCQKCKGNEVAQLFVKGVQCIKKEYNVDLFKAFQEFPDDQHKCVQRAKQLSEQANLNTEHKLEIMGGCLFDAWLQASKLSGTC